MCGIVGIVQKEDEDAVPSLRKMMESIKHRGPDGAGATASGVVCRSGSIDGLRWEELYGNSAMGHTRLAVVGGLQGQQPFKSNDGKLVLLHNGEIYNYKELRESLLKSYRFDTRTDSEVLVHLLSAHYNGDLFEAVNEIIPLLDGVFAIAVTDGTDIVIARDLIGVKQLYWSENGDIFAFSSEKKALWNVGLYEAIHRLLPGEVIRFSAGGIEKRRRNSDFLHSERCGLSDYRGALDAYDKTLRDAVRKRIQDLDKVGIIFSGGVDSVLVASIAKELGADVTCYVAGVEGCSDLEYACKAAMEMGLPLKVNRLKYSELLDYIPKVINCIEDRSLGQIEVAIPIMASVEMAHKDNQIVLLTGQAADELFGGYPWYRKIVELDGYDEFEFRMWDDVKHLYNETLEREDKITMAYGIELRVPYLDPQVIKTAFSIVPQLKVRSAQDTVGKYIHRALADVSGVPAEIAWRSKEAAQHGAGIHSNMVKLAESAGFDNLLAEELGYHSSDSLEEVLGSSQRYGYKYDRPGRWATQDHVQLWLDDLACEMGLLSPNEHDLFEPFRQKTVLLKTA